MKTYYLSEEELEKYRNMPKQKGPNIPREVGFTNNVGTVLQSWMKRQGIKRTSSKAPVDWRWPQNRKSKY
jgi:hypothetical protein